MPLLTYVGAWEKKINTVQVTSIIVLQSTSKVGHVVLRSLLVVLVAL